MSCRRPTKRLLQTCTRRNWNVCNRHRIKWSQYCLISRVYYSSRSMPDIMLRGWPGTTYTDLSRRHSVIHLTTRILRQQTATSFISCTNTFVGNYSQMSQSSFHPRPWICTTSALCSWKHFGKSDGDYFDVQQYVRFTGYRFSNKSKRTKSFLVTLYIYNTFIYQYRYIYIKIQEVVSGFKVNFSFYVLLCILHITFISFSSLFTVLSSFFLV